MKVSKIALAGMGVLGLVLATSAQASTTRSTESLPSASVKAKKVRISRTSAPLADSSSLNPAGVGLLVAGVGLAGWGVVEGLSNNNPDSPGGA